jgi:allantoate deiminase
MNPGQGSEIGDAAATVMRRCESLANISEEPDLIVRPYGSQAMNEANNIVAGWMREAGMSTRRDEIGNLIGRYEGTGEKTLVLGSHLDTVRDAGKYDGILGVMVALACVQRLHNRGERLPFSVEVVAFADEEGLRFGTTFLGSSVYAGVFEEELLSLEDHYGVTLREAVRAFGGDPDALEGDGRRRGDLLGYLEVHIEQGPVLEQEDLPVGVVSAVSGQSRVGVGFTGEVGHVGTVPMGSRRDALCPAAEFVVEVERAARREPGSVATVGEISSLPGASNVIPGEAKLSLDVRHPEDAARERLCDHLEARAREIAACRGCESEWRVRQQTGAVAMDPELCALLERAVEETGTPARRLSSGAGHDAMQVAVLAPVAILFVRCERGISHNSAESVDTDDVGAAIEVVRNLLSLVSRRVEPGGAQEGE